MIKVEKIGVWGFEHAIRGMRNPMNSWDKSDSKYVWDESDGKFDACEWVDTSFEIGPNDLGLMQKLYKAGPEHRKYLRQIFVSMDIIAPHYWWYDFDTYKVGVVRNSCSKNHKLMSKPFELNDFSWEHLFKESDEEMTPEYYAVEGYMFSPTSGLEIVINILNACRQKYLETKDKKWWWQATQLLPLSYNHRATITMNYENVVSIIKQRDNHILDEFKDFVEILKGLPYIREIINGSET